MADDLAALAPWLSLPEWLAAALADLLATLHNTMRTKDGQVAHRDEFLEAWGLVRQAQDFRRAVEASRKTPEKTAALAALFRSMKDR